MLEAVARKEERIAVQKTYKLFIGGKFVRRGSGPITPAQAIANLPRASRKDFRDAVVAARGAVGPVRRERLFRIGKPSRQKTHCWILETAEMKMACHPIGQ